MIQQVVSAAKGAGIKVALCGEMAGDPFCTIILVGMGLDELSMNALSLLKVKKIIRSTNFQQATELVNEILGFSTVTEIEEFLRKELAERYAGEMPDINR